MARFPGDEAAAQSSDTGEPVLVVALGASAGGLEALRRLVKMLPAKSGMAFIIVQHLDPAHASMLVDLLAPHTEMTVCQAGDAMPVGADRVYVIPPGVYLAVGDGMLLLSEPAAPHGARLPFDFLRHSLAASYGVRAVAVVLTGTGADGSAGIVDIKSRSGLVIAQSPEEAEFDGMPHSAIETKAVDAVLALDAIPAALLAYRSGQDREQDRGPARALAADSDADPLAQQAFPAIIALLRDTTAHDFTLYKPGTLQRRIERRMGLAAIKPTAMAAYLALLQQNRVELDLLAKDMLINVTRFFRDSAVFAMLDAQVISRLIAERDDETLRIWIAGCSTGEESYSFAILCHEHLMACHSTRKLQVFASDVDADAVALAREGVYAETIAADVSPARLERYFTHEDGHYRISRDVRGMIVFTVQDVVSDPPFSRLDLISCRNLLIYLRPEAQTRIINLFHFALRDGGILVLGGAESIGQADGFEAVAKTERIYRRTGRNGPRTIDYAVKAGRVVRPARLDGQKLLDPAAPPSLAELVRRMVLDAYAPAAVLINQRHECLFSLGPVDRYLQVAAGMASHDLLAMSRPAMRTRLRASIRRAKESQLRVVAPGGTIDIGGNPTLVSLDIQPVTSEGEPLLLVCFVEVAPGAGTGATQGAACAALPTSDGPAKQDSKRVIALERELEVTRTELLGAIQDLELSGEDQKAINEEALSVNEEFQSTNEELLTSKEELQSLNEELTALNGQLQETLERQRTTANDLQNVLFSTDVATLFLDRDLKIRLFTPATRTLFNVIPGDIGRPLADLSALGGDDLLVADAQHVLASAQAVEREVAGRDDRCFTRRILPYRTQQGAIEGVVITFSDITERNRIAEALKEASQIAERATTAKSRFLAAASHDLRQPLQTLSLLQGLLARSASGIAAGALVGRFEQTIDVMSGLLNKLLDINQIETGIVQVTSTSFHVGGLLDALRTDLFDAAAARGLQLRVVACGLMVETDRQLLDQILRNLVSNAIKYTRTGRVLIGCRRHRDFVRIEVWDSGIGIPEAELEAIFEEYHQIGNQARERALGLGLGLSIVQRIAELLKAPLRVRSWLGRGSVFSIDIPCALPGVRLAAPSAAPPAEHVPGEHVATEHVPGVGLILVVDDDPDVRALLAMFLEEEGHRVVAAADGATALALVTAGAWPDLIIADYNLPNRMSGVAVVQEVRAATGMRVPVIILTGDISRSALSDIAGEDCVQYSKPMSLSALASAIGRLLPTGRRQRDVPALEVSIVDHDPIARAALRALLQADGRIVADHPTAEAFLASYVPDTLACLLIDADLPGLDGLGLLGRLRETGNTNPVIMMTSATDVSTAVAAMHAGAADFIEKPVHPVDLLARIDRALVQARDQTARSIARDDAARLLGELTDRQREIMDFVLDGKSSKTIATILGISPRTVEVHRAAIMHKTAANSLPELARLALIARRDHYDVPAAPR